MRRCGNLQVLQILSTVFVQLRRGTIVVTISIVLRVNYCTLSLFFACNLNLNFMPEHMEITVYMFMVIIYINLSEKTFGIHYTQ
jgi:hypothetical protein